MSKPDFKLPFLFACFVFFLSPTTALWASVAGSVAGTVSDDSGSVLPHASVTLREVDTGLSYSAQTDSRGFYTLPVLPVGRYELRAEAQGFEAYLRSGIVLDTNAALTIDVTLQPGTVRQTVTVADNALHIETASTADGSGDRRPADDRGSAERPQLHGPAVAATRRGPGNFDLLDDGAGRGRDDPRSVGHAESGQPSR